MTMSFSACKVDQDLSIYAILNLREPPRLLISKSGSRQFHCYFGLPLPSQIIVFRLGRCKNIGYNSRLSIDICLDSGTPPFRIGYLDENVHSTCCEPKWPDDFLTRSHVLHEKDKMAKLLLTIEGGNGNGVYKDLSNITPEKFQQLEKRQLVVKLTNELTPDFQSKLCSISPERPTKKTKHNNSKECEGKRKRESFPGDSNKNDLVQTTLASSFSLVTKKSIMDFTPAPSPERLIPIGDGKENSPSGRWGHSGCVVNDNRFIIIGGQGENYQMVKDYLWVFDCESSTWKAETSHSNGAYRRMGHTSTFDPVRKVIYVYGGSKNKRWFKDVHILDIETWKWTDIKAVGNAPKRSYHTSCLFQGKLLVFGGVYPNPTPQPDGFSNDLYMFNPETSSWYQPIVTGKKPPPRSGHSLKLYTENKAIIFGGWDAPQCYNDIFFLDLTLMEYEEPNVIGIKPTPRSWHASALISKSKLLIHGGFDGANDKVLGDSFIFDIEKLTWLKVNLCEKIQPCVGHVMFSCHNSCAVNKKQIMVFGGGDNRGTFFSNCVKIHSSTDQETILS